MAGVGRPGMSRAQKRELCRRWKGGHSPSGAPRGRRRLPRVLSLADREEISRRWAESPRLRWLVAKKLSQQWSPEQIAGWLKLRFPRDEAMQVSHETIYRSLFIQARGVLKKELMAHLRTRRRITSRRWSSAIRALSCW